MYQFGTYQRRRGLIYVSSSTSERTCPECSDKQLMHLIGAAPKGSSRGGQPRRLSDNALHMLTWIPQLRKIASATAGRVTVGGTQVAAAVTIVPSTPFEENRAVYSLDLATELPGHRIPIRCSEGCRAQTPATRRYRSSVFRCKSG